MITAILVDDEPIILNNLRNNYDWSALNIEIVATCSDGDEAFEKIGELVPDLIITDIKMPTMDGIELIKLLQKANIYPKVIFATGHSDFEYTREAIRLGAYDYLLKPINPTELEETVTNCVKEIIETKAKMANENRESCEHSLQKYFNTEKHHKRNRLNDSITNKLLDYYKIDKISLNTIHASLSSDTSPTGVDYNDCIQLIKRLNFNLGLETYFAFSMPNDESMVIITFRTPANRSTNFDKANENYMQTIQSTLLENLGVDASTNVYPHLISTGFNAEKLYTLYSNYLNNKTVSDNDRSSYDDSQTQRYIHDALAYIHDHFGDPIKIQDVADYVYLSESHFSSLFTKQVGVSFSKYLAKYRIDKSKVYMHQYPYAKIYEISNHVGYSDARYFSTLFKKTEGITPSEYMKTLF